jgi:hypothetical protein
MNALIPHTIDGHVVGQRITDGYVNATAMCKAAGKRWNNYWQNDTSQDFAAELEADTGIPVSELIQSVKGGFPELQGTWVHPHVAINLAIWLSPRFAVQVAKWVYEWLTRGAPQPAVALPFHLRRYVTNSPNVPRGHFSVLQEMTIALIAPLEFMGYTLPEQLWPDISEGKIVARWFREKHGVETKDMPTYQHEFEDGRKPIYARAYPNRLLCDFRTHLHDVWLPQRAMAYFKERDPVALAYLPKLLPPPASEAA